jgi:hypothetical protein
MSIREVHLGPIERPIPGSPKCPRCGKPADGGTSIDDREAKRMPKPGDLAICLYCGQLNCYDAKLQPREVSRTERRQLLRRSPRLGELLKIAARGAQALRRRWQ